MPLSKLDIQYLITAQTMVGMASRKLYDTFQRHTTENKNKQIYSKEFMEELEESIQKKLDKNNEMITAVDKELLRRISKDFPNATTEKYMVTLEHKFKEEGIRYAKSQKKDQPKGKVKKLQTARQKNKT